MNETQKIFINEQVFCLVFYSNSILFFISFKGFVNKRKTQIEIQINCLFLKPHWDNDKKRKIYIVVKTNWQTRKH